MSAKDKTKGRVAKTQSQAAISDVIAPEADETEDLEAPEPASARNIPRPRTSLASAFQGDINKLTVSLLGDVASAPALADVEKLNKKGDVESRTPLMTVILAVLAKAGGSMQLAQLAAETRKYWNRPFPTVPYTDEEFIYIILRNSDSVRVS
ncbi:MAG: hypothetical protein WBG50_10860 [Desulfomonilaceae bacterium]